MDEITRFLEEFYASLPPQKADAAVRQRLLNRLEAEYMSYLSQGRPKKDAVSLTLMHFGFQDALDAELRKEKLLDTYKRFRTKYPLLIRGGFLGILIVPAVFLILMFSLESKLIFLTAWIVSIILLAAYLICVEYIDYRYKKLLESEKLIEGEQK
ncbi:hypothetical protein C3B58_03270 [Lactonifactor longoviformis]|uniref:Uncharacterized protein n=1 Tax=Lactonifactor longoviformis DSM 17459 TaxID=1122155 RepID=A0A1M4VM27_9CLOT|nr:hypothetical protein [Lactonifactor longoviformis]POP34330.1 hypothetical protein C3B58_03270 [Lactonifactor longoviformis]SHE70121.1 hypothetical protein SAMN02745158_01300 [Lactonifactor longoviformis DSM 17459]